MSERKKALQAIITTEPGVEQIALNEIQITKIPFKFLEWIDSGVILIELDNGFESLVSAFKTTSPVFIRHICPVHSDFSMDIGNNPEFLENEFIKIMDLLILNKSFSVQTRLYGKEETQYKRFDINQKISDYLINKGFTLDVKKPEQVISIVISPKTVYMGISMAEDNLSDWGGGARRFSRDVGLISRAEFKLLEAIDIFKLKFPHEGNALDLGAAPGGWTRVLRMFDLNVTAVDPAELHPSILKDSKVTHVRQLAQNYLKPDMKFDVIVNDMRMDAKESAGIMGLACQCLKPSGIAVMTLKLPGKGMQKKAYQAMDFLKQWYRIIGARQLFHNRLEVTVILKKKEENDLD